MSGIMRPLPFDVLLHWIITEYKENKSIFGIPSSLFFKPKIDDPFTINNLFGSYLSTPIGPAAGPHTQMTQNIITAWLSGARYIELKTVQILDELEIPRPCIDMADEGYNVEWSQELKLDQSVSEYTKAWALIHILHKMLGFADTTPVGTVFNMSVGYNLEGIQSPQMTHFMNRMVDASEELSEIKSILKKDFPEFGDIFIPTNITNNVTLSTMHGCPPDEIEKIANYLLEEKNLHTTVKLNPTLLGRETVLDILHNNLGFTEIDIPESIFEHDLAYSRAIDLIKTLQKTAARKNLTFGVKLSNTLPVKNHKHDLPGNEMYMSGRPLYPITMNLFLKLAREFDGKLNVSFSAGADALNITSILSSGAYPVTTASDLLKPGGYSRLGQYLQNIKAEMRFRSLNNLSELAAHKLSSLEAAASEALSNPRYKKAYHSSTLPKVKSGLEFFDCITAPCVELCPVQQNIPEYIWLLSQGKMNEALAVITDRNPLPNITGYVCTHICQSGCTRINYDESVAIRNLKRVAAEKGLSKLSTAQKSDKKIAIIGSGPSGLAAASFLASKGLQVTIFESRDKVGGMMRMIPSFRLPTDIIEKDVERIISMGVEIKTSHTVTHPPENLLSEGYAAVYVAAGFQKDLSLDILGIDGTGVFYALNLLEKIRRGERPNLGKKALVIGGGDTAIDAARTSQRITGAPTTILYRRTRKEMPASAEELKDAMVEGVVLEELVTPVQVMLKNGIVTGLLCQRNKLGEPDSSGRRRPVIIPGSEFLVETDSIIIAIGQEPDLAFLNASSVSRQKNGSILANKTTQQTSRLHIYAGGDVVDGPDSIIAACADGLRFAEQICADLGIAQRLTSHDQQSLKDGDLLEIKQIRARKEPQNIPTAIPVAERRGFELIESTFKEEEFYSEARRCMQCASICDKCVEVCPNRANITYKNPNLNLKIWDLESKNENFILPFERPFVLKQSSQIIHLADLCNECGNCESFCVHDGKPFMQKPRLFLNEDDFYREIDNAFIISTLPDGWSIRRREGGQTSTLIYLEKSNALNFENEDLLININSVDFNIEKLVLKKSFSEKLVLSYPAEMFSILFGLIKSANFIPFQSSKEIPA